jgi:CRP-like cAMP-binding protein
MQAATFKRMTDTQKALRQVLNKYALARLAQVAQNAICANAHSTEARLARRLLIMQDRSHSDEIRATQGSLASMLGVRRTTVTCLAISLQQRNIIRYVRGVLTVLDGGVLEKISCECYRAA